MTNPTFFESICQQQQQRINRWGVSGSFPTLSASAKPKRITGPEKHPLLLERSRKATPVLIMVAVEVAMLGRSQTPLLRKRAKSWARLGDENIS
jgi:hypothetical protein